jgi:hypothetical protein
LFERAFCPNDFSSGVNAMICEIFSPKKMAVKLAF